MRINRRWVAVAAAMGLVATLQVGSNGALGATPESGTLAVKSGGSATLSYRGTVPPGVGSPAACEDNVNADFFTLNITGNTPTFYQNNDTLMTVRIEWDPTSGPGTDPIHDLALEVREGGPNGPVVASSDGGSTREVAALENPDASQYVIVTCDFSNAAPQNYFGQVSLNSTPKVAETLPAPSNARGLQFMPIVTVDPQRDIAEPSLRYDKEGNIYTCGPFGASRAADYAQKSEDDGDTFRVLGEPPEGRISEGGGGDCELATNPQRDPTTGNYNLSYTGLEALLNFSTGRSQDEGRTFLGAPASASIPLVDRQWMEATGSNEVYLFYNQIPFGGTLQHSVDGGLTYAPASEPGNATGPDIFRPGNIIIDHNTNRNPDPVVGDPQETVYGTYTNDNDVMVFRTSDQGLTFERFKVVTAKGRPDNLFPSIDIDTQGNLYAAWIEKGSFNAYYSFSRDQGETWSAKQLVNRRGASTTVMPWISAGSPGRVAVSFYCTPVDGNPETGDFRGPWDVCMNQSTNALGQGADFSQVKVTHHPIHWDSICLSGLACNVTGGDRTLLDFFQNRVDPRDGRVSVVFNESNKQPGDPDGPIAIVTYSKQKTGPSLFAGVGTVPPDNRPIVRSTSNDPLNDAEFEFSSFGTPPVRQNVDGLDILSLKASPSSIVGQGKAIKFQLRMRDLSDATLTQAFADMRSTELKFVIRWFSAYRPDWVIANLTPDGTFSFYRGFLNLNRCEQTQDGKLEIYPAPAVGRKTVPGNVNEGTNTITLKMPYAAIDDFDLASPTATPTVGQARSGDRIGEVTAFTFGRPQPTPGNTPVCPIVDYYNQADSTPSFDYVLP